MSHELWDMSRFQGRLRGSVRGTIPEVTLSVISLIALCRLSTHPVLLLQHPIVICFFSHSCLLKRSVQRLCLYL